MPSTSGRPAAMRSLSTCSTFLRCCSPNVGGSKAGHVRRAADARLQFSDPVAAFIHVENQQSFVELQIGNFVGKVLLLLTWPCVSGALV